MEDRGKPRTSPSCLDRAAYHVRGQHQQVIKFQAQLALKRPHPGMCLRGQQRAISSNNSYVGTLGPLAACKSVSLNAGTVSAPASEVFPACARPFPSNRDAVQRKLGALQNAALQRTTVKRHFKCDNLPAGCCSHAYVHPDSCGTQAPITASGHSPTIDSAVQGRTSEMSKISLHTASW